MVTIITDPMDLIITGLTDLRIEVGDMILNLSVSSYLNYAKLVFDSDGSSISKTHI
jgi:hypothetical protein